MSKKAKSIRYKGLTRISATFTKSELSALKEVAQRYDCSQALAVNLGCALLLLESGYPEMNDRVAQLILSGKKAGVGGGQKRVPIKKVVKRRKGVKVIVKGEKHLIGQTELDV